MIISNPLMLLLLNCCEQVFPTVSCQERDMRLGRIASKISHFPFSLLITQGPRERIFRARLSLRGVLS